MVSSVTLYKNNAINQSINNCTFLYNVMRVQIIQTCTDIM